MVKTPKLSLVAYIAGIAVIVIAIVRWLFQYNDPSQFALSAAIGIIIISGSYVYHQLRNINEDLKKLDGRIDAFNDWMSRKEFS